jgi:hypothetical protein
MITKVENKKLFSLQSIEKLRGTIAALDKPTFEETANSKLNWRLYPS